MSILRGRRPGHGRMACATVAVFGLLCLAADGTAAADPFAAWLDGLRAEARSRGIGEDTLKAALDGIAPIPRVVELDRQQPEFTLSFQQYLARVVPTARIEKGRRKLSENRVLLEETGRRFGVQPRFIVALWGIETDFGRVTGGFPVIPALATLAHDGRRSAYFRGELLNALTILDQGHIAPREMMGSWAGAMGQSQFMPSSFLNFAVDGDGDGRKDIWETRADVFASAANYLARSGWRDDQTWGRPVKLPVDFDPTLAGLETTRRLSEWQKLGVRRIDGRDLPTRDLPASVVFADGPGSPAFIVYDNFRALMKWNRSIFFGIAVGTLADALGQG